MAIRSNNLPALAFKIDSLLVDPERLARMRQAVERLARPQAVFNVVSIVTGTAGAQPVPPSPR